MSSACVSCGACCAAFRVSFYWAQTTAHPDGQVPQALTLPISPHLVAMRGTERQPVRCIALQGDIGRAVACSIYAQRADTCREFAEGDERCQQARQRHGLPSLNGLHPTSHA